MDLSFSGSGFMGCYYFGVVDCWKRYIPMSRINRVAGASAGSLIAAYYLMNLPLGPCLQEIIGLTEEIRTRSLGVFDRSHQIVDELPKILDRLFPDDAHKQVSGRLHVCMTRLKDMKKVIVSEFESKKDLIDVLNCSCYIPVWSGNHVSTYKGVKHVDGGMTDNLPVFDENTIRICCFAGQTDISPYDRSQKELLSSSIMNTPLYFTLANVRRGAMALWPPPASSSLDTIERGFHDTKQFILDNDLIQCEQCYRNFNNNDSTSGTQSCKFSFPNPTISPAVTPAMRRRFFEAAAEPANLSSGDPLGAYLAAPKSAPNFCQLQALHKELVATSEELKRNRSQDSMKESYPTVDINSNTVPSIVIVNDCDVMTGMDQDENSSPPAAAAAAETASEPKDRHQTKKRSRASSIAAQQTTTTLGARRKSSLALAGLHNSNNELLVVQDRFKFAPNPLPSCPPSPNLNRHCNECLRLRQAARNDHLEDNIRQVVESFINSVESPSKRGIGRKLSGPLRWIRTQFRPKHCYDFNQQHVPLE